MSPGRVTAMISLPYLWLERVIGPGFDEVAAVHAVLRTRGPGVMVDVGAHHGQSLRPFAEDGWQVFAFEPDPVNRAVLEHRVAQRANVTVDGRAIASRDGETVMLYTSEVSSGISTLTPFHPSHRAAVQVGTVRLDTYLAPVDDVTVLKTDAEGHDFPILQTFPWWRLHPRAVICEFEDRRTAGLGYEFGDMAEFLAGQGYVVYVSEWYPVVEYGRVHRWRSLRQFPTALADVNAWGNLLAVDPVDSASILRQAAWPRRLRMRGVRLIKLLRR